MGKGIRLTIQTEKYVSENMKLANYYSKLQLMWVMQMPVQHSPQRKARTGGSRAENLIQQQKKTIPQTMF